jgi:protein phosphatase
MTNGTLTAAGRSHTGRVRDHNEDTAGITEITTRDGSYLLWLVADGMGGGVKGEVASAIARDETIAALQADSDWSDPPANLREAFRQANVAVHRTGSANGQLSRSAMGTTLVAALAEPDSGKYWLANIGDSRAYLAGRDGLRQLTRDHSFVAEQVEAGILTPEEARTADRRNVITRAVGTDPEVEADVTGPFTLSGDERLILCSDGLHGMIDDAAIAALATNPSLEEAADSMIQAANAAGGRDNVTVVIGGWAASPVAAAVTETRVLEGKPRTGGKKPSKTWLWLSLGGLGAAAMVAAVALFFWPDSEADNVVRRNETCQQFAARNGTDEARVRDANRDQLGNGQPCTEGMKLRIPTGQPAGAGSGTPGATSATSTPSGFSQDSPAPTLGGGGTPVGGQFGR